MSLKTLHAEKKRFCEKSENLQKNDFLKKVVFCVF